VSLDDKGGVDTGEWINITLQLECALAFLVQCYSLATTPDSVEFKLDSWLCATVGQQQSTCHHTRPITIITTVVITV
jgi:hypothetical protein